MPQLLGVFAPFMVSPEIWGSYAPHAQKTVSPAPPWTMNISAPSEQGRYYPMNHCIDILILAEMHTRAKHLR